jgi:hypothetical protein
LLPPLRERALPVDYFSAVTPEQLVTQVERTWGSWWLVGLFNQADHAREMRISWHQLGLEAGAYHATESWSGSYLGCSAEGTAVTVGAHGAAVVAIRLASADPTLLSSSFHLSQGGTEITGWDYERDSTRIRWTMALGRAAAGTFLIWIPPDMTPRRLVSTARAAHWRRQDGNPSIIIVEAEVDDHAEFALELERGA